jgi:hypothetical protein
LPTEYEILERVDWARPCDLVVLSFGGKLRWEYDNPETATTKCSTCTFTFGFLNLSPRYWKNPNFCGNSGFPLP